MRRGRGGGGSPGVVIPTKPAVTIGFRCSGFFYLQAINEGGREGEKEGGRGGGGGGQGDDEYKCNTYYHKRTSAVVRRRRY